MQLTQDGVLPDSAAGDHCCQDLRRSPAGLLMKFCRVPVQVEASLLARYFPHGYDSDIAPVQTLHQQLILVQKTIQIG